MLFVALLSSPGALACAAEPEVLVLDVQHRGSSGYQETAPKSLTAARERASELARCGKKFVIDRARPADAVLNKVVVKVNADGEVTEVIRPSRNPGGRVDLSARDRASLEAASGLGHPHRSGRFPSERDTLLRAVLAHAGLKECKLLRDAR